MYTTDALFYVLAVTQLFSLSFAGQHKTLLRDISALTLYKGRYTTGRRNSPVPQLRCVGGSAGCGSLEPSIIQCSNAGFDGYDTQWECKADMSKRYKLGSVQVTCEGYEYPEDPYILVGSCGLEYSIDHASYQDKADNSYYSAKDTFKSSDKSSGYLILIGGCIILYVMYKAFFDNQGNRSTGSASNPPPPGFRPEFYDDSQKTSGTNTQSGSSRTGDFLSGMATGGTLGYLFGRGTGSSSTRTHDSQYPSNYDSFGFTRSETHDNDDSTHTTVSYGGTKRR